jgi:3-oxoacyl-[acyl-carrier protein] reductase
MAEKMCDGSLRGRTAIVTGAGRGLGRAMALGLVRAGANVMITAARNQHELDAVEQAAANEQAGAIHTMLADAASEDDSLRVVDRTIREFGAVHILVNNAGRGMRFVSERFFRYTDSLLAN